MAAPEILPDQSAPEGKTFRAYFFQPAAMNGPTAWTTAGTTLPPGLSLDTSNGRVSGIPTTAGTGVFALRCTNSDGASAAMLFTMHVDSTPPVAPGGFFGVTIDLGTGLVTYDGLEMIIAKSNDDLLQQIRFVRNGLVVSDIVIDELKFAIKFGELDEVVVSGEDFVQVGTGEATVYRHATILEGSGLDEALDFGAQKVKLKEIATTEVGKRVAQFIGLAEYTIAYTNSGAETVGRDPAIWTTRTVPIEIVRELVPNS